MLRGNHFDNIHFEEAEPVLSVNRLITALQFLRDEYGEGDTAVAVAIPGKRGFTTRVVAVAYPAVRLDTGRGKAIAIVAYKEKEENKIRVAPDKS